MVAGRPAIWNIMEHQGRRLDWLARRLGYTPVYVRGIKCGQFPVTAQFRRRCAEVLDLPEAVLFAEGPDSPECEAAAVTSSDTEALTAV